MKSKAKFLNLVLASLLTISLVSACGEEAVTTADAQQYTQEQQTATQQKTTDTNAQPTVKNTSKQVKPTNVVTKPATGTTVAKPATTTPVATATSNLSLAQKLVTKSKQVYDGLKNYTANLAMYSKRNDKVSPTANPVINAEFKYTFESPKRGVFVVLKHNISIAIGAKMVWEGGDSVVAKATGVLGFLPLTLKLNDSKISTNREWRLDQLDHISILGRALDPKAVVELAGKTTASGKEAYMIKVKNVGLDSEVIEENIALDAKTFMILGDEMYSKDGLIFHLKMTIEGTNTTLAPELFTV